MRRARRTLAIVAFTLVSCSTPVVPASTPTSKAAPLRLYAATATIPLLNDLVARYVAAHPTLSFDTLTGDYAMVIERLIVDKEAYFLTNHLPGDSLLWAAPIGQDGIAVIVHPDNPVRRLTSDQLRAIYQGRIVNWREVGGQDMPITVFSREDGSGTRAEFERLLMGERRTTQAAQLAPSSAAVVASVAAAKDGIGYVSMSYLDSTIKALAIDNVEPTLDNVYQNLYPLRATLFVVGLAEPQDKYRTLIAWIQSPEGQLIVAQKYAPLLRP
jgi:phosphate transport system substrate-binding protein